MCLSFTACSKVCAGCTGAGPDNCQACASGYQDTEGTCTGTMSYIYMGERCSSFIRYIIYRRILRCGFFFKFSASAAGTLWSSRWQYTPFLKKKKKKKDECWVDFNTNPNRSHEILNCSSLLNSSQSFIPSAVHIPQVSNFLCIVVSYLLCIGCEKQVIIGVSWKTSILCMTYFKLQIKDWCLVIYYKSALLFYPFGAFALSVVIWCIYASPNIESYRLQLHWFCHTCCSCCHFSVMKAFFQQWLHQRRVRSLYQCRIVFSRYRRVFSAGARVQWGAPGVYQQQRKLRVHLLERLRGGRRQVCRNTTVGWGWGPDSHVLHTFYFWKYIGNATNSAWHFSVTSQLY